MNIYLTLDYELFLGTESGSVEKCLEGTMAELSRIALENGARFTIFVDATYLLRLSELKEKYAALKADYDAVTRSLRHLAEEGHDLQLHIHPQWAYSDYDGSRWLIDSTHYKLSDIPAEKAAQLFADGCTIIEKISGRRPMAFRAGGFSAQPTELLVQLMTENGLTLDSSVYPGTSYNTPQQQYDYTTARQGHMYAFDRDLCVYAPGGNLKELPLSVYDVSPLYYWKLVFQRLTKQKKHRRIGDGQSVKTAGSSIRRRLTSRATTHATIDESKISFLWSAYKAAVKRGDDVFCVIGHPKLATPYSLNALGTILRKMRNDGAVFKTVSEIE